MHPSLKRIAVASLAAVSFTGATFGTIASADARPFHGGDYRKYHGGYDGGLGPGFIGGLAHGAFAAAPYYGVPYYGPDCYPVRQVFINRWGRRVVRWVRNCS